MAKPPSTPPHSDLDGVDEDARGNVAAADRAGDDAGDLEKARKGSSGRPPYADDQPERDDRSA